MRHLLEAKLSSQNLPSIRPTTTIYTSRDIYWKPSYLHRTYHLYIQQPQYTHLETFTGSQAIFTEPTIYTSNNHNIHISRHLLEAKLSSQNLPSIRPTTTIYTSRDIYWKPSYLHRTYHLYVQQPQYKHLETFTGSQAIFTEPTIYISNNHNIHISRHLLEAKLSSQNLPSIYPTTTIYTSRNIYWKPSYLHRTYHLYVQQPQYTHLETFTGSQAIFTEPTIYTSNNHNIHISRHLLEAKLSSQNLPSICPTTTIYTSRDIYWKPSYLHRTYHLYVQQPQYTDLETFTGSQAIFTEPTIYMSNNHNIHISRHLLEAKLSSQNLPSIRPTTTIYTSRDIYWKPSYLHRTYHVYVQQPQYTHLETFTGSQAIFTEPTIYTSNNHNIHISRHLLEAKLSSQNLPSICPTTTIYTSRDIYWKPSYLHRTYHLYIQQPQYTHLETFTGSQAIFTEPTICKSNNHNIHISRHLLEAKLSSQNLPSICPTTTIYTSRDIYWKPSYLHRTYHLYIQQPQYTHLKTFTGSQAIFTKPTIYTSNNHNIHISRHLLEAKLSSQNLPSIYPTTTIYTSRDIYWKPSYLHRTYHLYVQQPQYTHLETFTGSQAIFTEPTIYTSNNHNIHISRHLLEAKLSSQNLPSIRPTTTIYRSRDIYWKPSYLHRTYHLYIQQPQYTHLETFTGSQAIFTEPTIYTSNNHNIHISRHLLEAKLSSQNLPSIHPTTTIYTSRDIYWKPSYLHRTYHLYIQQPQYTHLETLTGSQAIFTEPTIYTSNNHNIHISRHLLEAKLSSQNLPSIRPTTTIYTSRDIYWKPSYLHRTYHLYVQQPQYTHLETFTGSQAIFTEPTIYISNNHNIHISRHLLEAKLSSQNLPSIYPTTTIYTSRDIYWKPSYLHRTYHLYVQQPQYTHLETFTGSQAIFTEPTIYISNNHNIHISRHLLEAKLSSQNLPSIRPTTTIYTSRDIYWKPSYLHRTYHLYVQQPQYTHLETFTGSQAIFTEPTIYISNNHNIHISRHLLEAKLSSQNLPSIYPTTTIYTSRDIYWKPSYLHRTYHLYVQQTQYTDLETFTGSQAIFTEPTIYTSNNHNIQISRHLLEAKLSSQNLPSIYPTTTIYTSRDIYWKPSYLHRTYHLYVQQPQYTHLETFTGSQAIFTEPTIYTSNNHNIHISRHLLEAKLSSQNLPSIHPTTTIYTSRDIYWKPSYLHRT